MVLDTYFSLRKVTGSHYVEPSWESLVIWIDNKRLSCIWRLHANKPWGGGCIVWFRPTHPVKEDRKEIAKFVIDYWVGVRRKEFKSRVLHNAKPRLLHARESCGGYVNIWSKLIQKMKRWGVGQIVAVLDSWRASECIIQIKCASYPFDANNKKDNHAYSKLVFLE